ncbi:hypothetical protein [Micromonospora sp. NPDC050276]|uniref:hypothetical protein n=1 Tax=Micromonospora sp. NPDC050276 TaxID=3364278 RepID=UPI00378E9072
MAKGSDKSSGKRHVSTPSGEFRQETVSTAQKPPRSTKLSPEANASDKSGSKKTK